MDKKTWEAIRRRCNLHEYTDKCSHVKNADYYRYGNCDFEDCPLMKETDNETDNL